MFDMLTRLTNNNWVQIFGMPGLGKSSLLKNVTCFLGERNIYKDGVLYIDFLHVITYKEAIQIISTYLIEEDDAFYQSLGANGPDEFQEGVERLQTKIRLLKNKFLISLDNVDHLTKESYTEFFKFMGEIASPTVKVVFTSAKYSSDLAADREGFTVKRI